MLCIRLSRTGKKGQPYFRIVVADERKAVSSPYIEKLGQYDPRTKAIVLDKEQTTLWMNKGAKPSNTVAKLLEKEGLTHKSVVIKKSRKISKKELEKQKAIAAEEKAKEQAEKEAAKIAFEAEVEKEKAENAAAAEAEAQEEIAAETPAEEAPSEEKPAETV